MPLLCNAAKVKVLRVWYQEGKTTLRSGGGGCRTDLMGSADTLRLLALESTRGGVGHVLSLWGRGGGWGTAVVGCASVLRLLALESPRVGG